MTQEVLYPNRGKISSAKLNRIVDLVDSRLEALSPALLRDIPSEPLRLGLLGLVKLGELLGKGKIRDYLASQLGDSVED